MAPILPPTPDNGNWTREVRSAAVELIDHAAGCYRDATDEIRRAEAARALVYFLRCGAGHGLTPAELAQASAFDEATVLAITDPAVTE